MKTFFLKPLCFLLPVLFISTFIGCSDEETNKPDKENTPKITQFEQGDFICKNEGGVYTISFSTNADWKSAVNADWCELEPSSGNAGMHNITLIVSKNTNNEDREAVVRIECGRDFRTFKVSQKREHIIIAMPESITVAYSGGIVEINVQANIDYTYTIQDDWISIAPETKSLPLNNSTWRFTIAKNSTQYDRHSKIVFAGEEKSLEVDIYQSSRGTPENYDFEVDGLFYRILSISDLTAEIVGENYHGYIVYSGEIDIPDEVEYNGKKFKIIQIGGNCFDDSPITKVTIGKNISEIGELAFNHSSITHIEIPKNVTKIYNGAFWGCSSLSEVVIADGENILDFSYSNGSSHTEAFKGCPIKQLYLGRNLDYFPESPFSDLSNTEKITIGRNVTCLKGLSAARKVTEFVVPSNVTSIELSFSYWESLKKVIFEDGEEELVNNSNSSLMFHETPIDYVYIGRNFRGGSPFDDVAPLPITKIEIGQAVSILPDLRDLEKLEAITIPASVSKINSFRGCSNLRAITCEGVTPPLVGSWGNESFDNSVYVNGILSVPGESVSAYQSADGWKNFFTIQPIANQ